MERGDQTGGRSMDREDVVSMAISPIPPYQLMARSVRPLHPSVPHISIYPSIFPSSLPSTHPSIPLWARGSSTVSQACRRRRLREFQIQWSTTGLLKAIVTLCKCSVGQRRPLATFHGRVGHCVPMVGFILTSSSSSPSSPSSSSSSPPRYYPGCC